MIILQLTEYCEHKNNLNFIEILEIREFRSNFQILVQKAQNKRKAVIG